MIWSLRLVFLAGVLLAVTEAAATPSIDPKIAEFESGLRPAVEVEGEPERRWSLAERMEFWHVRGVSIAVLRNFKLAWAKAYGPRQLGAPEPIDTDTLFSVGSVSKIGTAAITLRLVEAGKLSLDQDVNAYLKRWQVPANEFTQLQKVTLREILSHTGGFGVSGFPDFQPGDMLPTILDTLDGRPPAKTPPIRVEYLPGSQARYSGGGIEVEQLVIEEATGLSFAAAARKHLLDPLGMARSTYQQPLPAGTANVAKAHDAKGQPTALPRGWESMPETAASGLWTTPTEFSKLLLALMESWRGPGPGFLRHATAETMMTEVGPSVFGLGPALDGKGRTRRFSHSGSNDSYKAWFEGHLATGDGVIIFTNAANDGELRNEIRSAVAAAEGWDPGLARSRTIPRFPVEAAELARLAGTWRAEPSDDPIARRAVIGLFQAGYRVTYDAVTLVLTLQDGKLLFSMPGDPRSARLLAEDSSHFVPENRGEVSFEFLRDARGEVSSLVLRVSDAVLTARRVTP